MDLNLLRVFVAVYDGQSATIAAERLFVTQSAVSQALARLRRDVGDPLFRREGRSLVPTPVAEMLYPEFCIALARVDTAIAAVAGFDPRTSTHRFRIALSELGEVGFLPKILPAMMAEAPSVTLDVVPLEVTRVADWLERGTVDLAVSSTPPIGRADGETLLAEQYVLLMSSRHPLAAARRITSDALQAAPHVAVSGDSAAAAIDAFLAHAGIRLATRITVGHFSALPGLLDTGVDVAVVPASLADRWRQTWPLVARPLPVQFGPVHVRLYARRSEHHSEALSWFRGIVVSAVRGVERRLLPPLGGTVS